ncbi:MAG: DUF4126 domain-containing protein [Ktedonobacterales bacterium]|nr:DUF4126 domain-containing protein [Ktedonobacterales bacterium]
MLDFSGFFVLLASLGLSLSAGVRAYLPVLALGIASHLPSVGGFKVTLLPSFSWIGEPLFLGLLVLLTVYEISADKIPVVDHLNDTVHTIIRPLSGALIFTCTSNPLTNSGAAGMVAAAVIGGTIAGTTHVAKAGVVRPASTLTTAGLANPLISIAEDILVVFTTVISLLVPVLGALIFVVLAVLVVRGLVTLGKRRQARRAAAATAATALPPTTYSGYR